MHENTTLDSTLDSLITTTTRLTPLTTPGLPPAQHALASSRDTTVLWGCYVQVELLEPVFFAARRHTSSAHRPSQCEWRATAHTAVPALPLGVRECHSSVVTGSSIDGNESDCECE